MDNIQRYYLTMLSDGSWKITNQTFSDGVWNDTQIMQIYQDWQEAIASSYAPLAFDPTDSWPNELGGQS